VSPAPPSQAPADRPVVLHTSNLILFIGEASGSDDVVVQVKVLPGFAAAEIAEAEKLGAWLTNKGEPESPEP